MELSGKYIRRTLGLNKIGEISSNSSQFSGVKSNNVHRESFEKQSHETQSL